MPSVAFDRAAHRVEPGAEAGRTLYRDPVVGRAGPVQLAVRQPPDQRPAGQVGNGDIDLVQADVVAPGEGAATWQPPPWLAVNQRRSDPVSKHPGGVNYRVTPGCRAHLGYRRDRRPALTAMTSTPLNLMRAESSC
jgi:hypothetical protein